MAKIRTGGRPTAPENETAEDKFKRLASHRMSRAITAIQQIQSLAEARKSGTYSFTEQQVTRMLDALSEAFHQTKAAYERALTHKTDGGKQQAFTFD